MTRYDVDGDTAQFRVGFRPAVPGAGASLAGIEGWFDLEIDTDGELDLTKPITGEFLTRVDKLRVGNSVVSTVARRWLGGDDEMAARGTVSDVRRRPDGRFSITLQMELRGKVYPLPCRSNFVRNKDGSLRAWGTSRFAPVDVGIPIPRLLSPRIETTWEVDLRP